MHCAECFTVAYTCIVLNVTYYVQVASFQNRLLGLEVTRQCHLMTVFV
jgi:hypothetical protein